MEELKVINKKELKILNIIDAGSEANIIKVEYHNDIYAYKELSKKKYDNKSKKLNILHNLDLPSNIISPSYLVNDKGYLIPYLDRCINLGDIADSIRFEKKIEILKNLKAIIEFLNKNNIIYGDLKSNNILFDGLNPILIDIDNIIIDKYNYDLQTFFMKEYINKTGKIDINLDKYNFNAFTYCFINNLCYFRKMEEYIEENIATKNFKNFKDNENIEIIKRLTKFNSSYNDNLLIDNLSKNII